MMHPDENIAVLQCRFELAKLEQKNGTPATVVVALGQMCAAMLFLEGALGHENTSRVVAELLRSHLTPDEQAKAA